MTGDEVLGVVGKPVKAVMLGGGGSLDIERVVIVGIDGTVAKIIDVGQQSELQPQVGIVGKAGQDAECPALADIGRILRRQGNGN